MEDKENCARAAVSCELCSLSNPEVDTMVAALLDSKHPQTVR